MLFFRFLPAFLITIVSGTSSIRDSEENSVCCNSSIVISSTNFNSFNECTSFTGNISINTDITLATNGSNSLTFSNLGSINGSLFLAGGSSLDLIEFQVLETISGLLDFSGLSSPTFVSDFPALKYVQAVVISNTSLPIFDNFNVGEEFSADIITISDNPSLTEITFRSVRTVGILIISNNTSFPDIFVYSLGTLTGIYADSVGSNFDAPYLQSIAENLVFTNSELSNFNCPELKFVRGGLKISEPFLLENLTLPSLVSTGNFVIINTSQNSLSIDLPALGQVVTGGLNITGSISELSIPALISVNQSVDIVSVENSSSDSFNCTNLLRNLDSQLPNNQIACDGTTIHALATTVLTNSLGSPTATVTMPPKSTQTFHASSSSSHSHSSLTANTEAGIGVTITVFIALLSTLTCYLLRRKRRAKLASINENTEKVHGNELHGGGPYRFAEAELEDMPRVHETDAGSKDWCPKRGCYDIIQTPVELAAGDRGPSELPTENFER